MQKTEKFEALSSKEQEWLRQKLDRLNKYISDLVPEHSGSKVDAKILDQLWMAWKKSAPEDNEAAAGFLQAFGVGFGQLLVEEAGFEWAILTDVAGADFVVRALPYTANTRIVPIDFVLTRYENDENEFVAETQREIAKILAKAAEEWNTNGHQGWH